jgi:hypothetical protein
MFVLKTDLFFYSKIVYNINMKLSSKYIWDYDVKNLDLSNPRVLIWYLERKITCGDWDCLDKKTLKKYLPKLKINPYLKEILNKFANA